jgi:hypothetical protein
MLSAAATVSLYGTDTLNGSAIGYATQSNAQTSSLKLGKHDGSIFWLSSDSGLGRSQGKIIVKRSVCNIIGLDKVLVF